MKFKRSVVIDVESSALEKALANNITLRSSLPQLTEWTEDGGSLRGSATISGLEQFGVFECAVAIDQRLANGSPGTVRLRGRQQIGDIRWNATIEVEVVDSQSDRSQVHLTADVRVSGGGSAVGAAQVETALDSAVALLSAVVADDEMGNGAGRESDREMGAARGDRAHAALGEVVPSGRFEERGLARGRVPSLVAALVAGALAGYLLGKRRARG